MVVYRWFSYSYIHAIGNLWLGKASHTILENNASWRYVYAVDPSLLLTVWIISGQWHTVTHRKSFHIIWKTAFFYTTGKISWSVPYGSIFKIWFLHFIPLNSVLGVTVFDPLWVVTLFTCSWTYTLALN